MKVFVTLGFERRPFDRLLLAVDRGIASGIIPRDTLVQRGYSTHVPCRCDSVPFLPFLEMDAIMRRAEIIIAHAGVGSLLHCRHIGRIPILFPRRADRGEHVDDHQIIFARAVEERRRALVAYDSSQLFEMIENHARVTAAIAASVDVSEGGSRLRRYLGHRISEGMNREMRR